MLRTAACTALALLVLPGAAAPAATVERALAYASASPEQTLDLYLPAAGAAAKPPLVAFVGGRFWSRTDTERVIEWGVARPLAAEGAAVAVIRHRLAPEHRHPAFADDVAAALGWLVRHADRYGYDAGRIALAGHASGAHLASLVALDPERLRAAGVDPAAIAAVISLSGAQDLDPEEPLAPEQEALYAAAFPSRAARREASPLRRVAAGAPAFLLVVAESDVPGLRAEAVAMSEALRAAGDATAEAFVAPGRNHLNLLDLADERNPARGQVLGMLGLGPRAGELRELFAGRARWRDPPFSSEPFFALGARVQTLDADEAFLRELNRPFLGPDARAPRLRPKRYRALDLFALLDALGPERTGSGEWLVLTNARGERSTWRLDAMRPYQPVVVIGLDDERNLFRLTDAYHTRRMYSWAEPERRRIMARPLGAFLYFGKPPPDGFAARDFGRTALEVASFRRAAADPLAPLADLPKRLLRLVTVERGCVSCHSLRGVGAHAGHLRLADAGLGGGFALDLELYPPEAWRRYCFEQKAVADEVGATPVDLPPDLARELYDLVVRERERLLR